MPNRFVNRSTSQRYMVLRARGLLAIVAALMAGCSTAPTIVPAELTRIESTQSASTAWSKRIGGGGERPAVRFAPYVTDDAVYTASASGRVNAFNREGGATLWSVDVGPNLTAGISGDETYLFVATGNGEVFCLRQDDGSRVWSARDRKSVV